MSAAPAPRRRRWRWLLLAVALLLAGVATLPLWFNANRIAALALPAAGTASGLVISSSGEAELRWRPTPWLALPNVEVRTPQGALILSAERVEIALPWATLRGQAFEVDELQLHASFVDLEALAAWLDSRPPSEPSPLPDLARLEMRGGELRWGDYALQDADIDVIDFGPGQRFAMDAAGQVLLAGNRHPARLSLVATVAGDSASLRLRDLELEMSGDDPLPELRASGDWQLSPTWQLELAGRLAGWRQSWGELPQPFTEGTGPIDFELSQQGESALLAPATLRARAGDAEASATAVPEAMLAWLGAEQRPLLPPASGSARVPRLSFDGVQLEGLELEVDQTPPPPQ